MFISANFDYICINKQNNGIFRSYSKTSNY